MTFKTEEKPIIPTPIQQTPTQPPTNRPPTLSREILSPVIFASDWLILNFHILVQS